MRGNVLYRYEVVAVAYFVCAAIAGTWRGLTPIHLVAAWIIPAALMTGAYIQRDRTSPAKHIARQWASLALILLAYWEMQWFAADYSEPWEQRLQAWDTILLTRWLPSGNALTRYGVGLVQACYGLLYALPPLYLGIVYARKRIRAEHFLFTLFLGTFSAYLLLPHFRLRAPRIAFPTMLIPQVNTIWGKWDVWLLDQFDISTSVFPSGHVAVAFSAAFGLLRALPQRKAIWLGGLAMAACIWIATIYTRIHYAADGAASLLISIAAWRLSGYWDPYGVDS